MLVHSVSYSPASELCPVLFSWSTHTAGFPRSPVQVHNSPGTICTHGLGVRVNCSEANSQTQNPNKEDQLCILSLKSTKCDSDSLFTQTEYSYRSSAVKNKLDRKVQVITQNSASTNRFQVHACARILYLSSSLLLMVTSPCSPLIIPPTAFRSMGLFTFIEKCESTGFTTRGPGMCDQQVAQHTCSGSVRQLR